MEKALQYFKRDFFKLCAVSAGATVLYVLFLLTLYTKINLSVSRTVVFFIIFSFFSFCITAFFQKGAGGVWALFKKYFYVPLLAGAGMFLAGFPTGKILYHLYMNREQLHASFGFEFPGIWTRLILVIPGIIMAAVFFFPVFISAAGRQSYARAWQEFVLKRKGLFLIFLFSLFILRVIYTYLDMSLINLSGKGVGGALTALIVLSGVVFLLLLALAAVAYFILGNLPFFREQPGWQTHLQEKERVSAALSAKLAHRLGGREEK